MYLGIDIAKASLQGCLLKADGAIQAQLPNNAKGQRALHAWLKKPGGVAVWVALEASGSYGDDRCDYRYAQGYRLSVINPARIKAYGASQLKRHKTDAMDAALLADFCRTQAPALWQALSAEARELRD